MRLLEINNNDWFHFLNQNQPDIKRTQKPESSIHSINKKKLKTNGKMLPMPYSKLTIFRMGSEYEMLMKTFKGAMNTILSQNSDIKNKKNTG